MIWSNPTSLTLRKGACFFDFVLSITPVPREGPTRPKYFHTKNTRTCLSSSPRWGGAVGWGGGPNTSCAALLMKQISSFSFVSKENERKKSSQDGMIWKGQGSGGAG